MPHCAARTRPPTRSPSRGRTPARPANALPSRSRRRAGVAHGGSHARPATATQAATPGQRRPGGSPPRAPLRRTAVWSGQWRTGESGFPHRSDTKSSKKNGERAPAEPTAEAVNPAGMYHLEQSRVTGARVAQHNFVDPVSRIRRLFRFTDGTSTTRLHRDHVRGVRQCDGRHVKVPGRGSEILVPSPGRQRYQIHTTAGCVG